MKNASLTPAAFSTRKRILALLVAMLLLSTMLPVSAIGLDSPEKAEPAWTAEEIAGTFHVSEENITQLQEDDNGHTLFVLDEYTFVCAPNGARAAAVTYTADYPIELIVPCIDNGVMLGSALPYVDSPDSEMSWNGTYEFLNYDTGEVTPVKDANAFYVENADAPVALASFSTTINGKAIPHPSYTPGGTWTSSGYTTPYGGEGEAFECHGFALMIRDYLYAGEVCRKDVSQTLNTSNAEPFLNSLQNGTLIRARTSMVDKDGNPILHTFILAGKGNGGYYLYHANWPGNNQIAMTHFTIDEFTTRFVYAIYIWQQHGVVLHTKQYNSTYHQFVYKCGETKLEKHYAVVGGSNVECMTCGYVGSMGGITRGTNQP